MGGKLSQPGRPAPAQLPARKAFVASGTNTSPVETGSPCLLLTAGFQAETLQVAAPLGRAAQPGKSPLHSRVGGEGGHSTDRRSGGAEGSLAALRGKPRAHRQYEVSFFFTASGINGSDGRRPDDAKFQPDPQPASSPGWKGSPPPLP